MTFKWDTIKEESLEIPEIKLEKDELPKGFCNAHTPDCGSIKADKKCQCGKHKEEESRTLCSACYYSLPIDLREDINWCPQAYLNALSYLNEG